MQVKQLINVFLSRTVTDLILNRTIVLFWYISGRLVSQMSHLIHCWKRQSIQRQYVNLIASTAQAVQDELFTKVQY